MQYKNEWTIQDIIEYLERNKDIEEYEITVWNYEKLQEGVVTILENKKEVKVFEGVEDGSEDKEYTLKEFEEKYKILKFEREDENGELTPIKKERKGRDNGLYR